jgi:uncharacterized protein DUF6959
MRRVPVEIYSDATNSAVVRHPERRFPGVLVQGDTLHSLLLQLRAVRLAADLDPETAEIFDEALDQLKGYVEHYQVVLKRHDIELPFPRLEE